MPAGDVLQHWYAQDDARGEDVGERRKRWAINVGAFVCCIGFLVALSMSAGGWLIVFKGGTSKDQCDANLVRSAKPGFEGVCLGGGTERAGSSPLDKLYNKSGGYRCSCCGTPLFPSTTKFNSGTGWPSFWAPYAGNPIGYGKDVPSLFSAEVHCSKCGAHMGHVFDDGKGETGLRYCINGVCLFYDPSLELPLDLSEVPWVCNNFLMMALIGGGCCACGRVLMNLPLLLAILTGRSPDKVTAGPGPSPASIGTVDDRGEEGDGSRVQSFAS